MCFCCCITRKSIIIYLIVINIIAFIYGIIAISEFGSKTEIYKYLVDRIEYLEEHKTSRRLQYPYPYYYNNYNYDYAKLILDLASKDKIDSLTMDTLEKKGYGLIKSLKGIENGLGVLLFVFTIIFLAAEIVYLIFAWGTKEVQIMKTTLFNILNGVKIGVLTFAIIFIFLSILYGILLIAVLAQYISLIEFFDSCGIGMVVGMIYGYYCFWIFITLSCGFSKERSLFVEVGSEAKPGPKAEYDVNGNPIIKAVIPVQAVIVNQPNMAQPTGMNMNMAVPYQQVPYNNPQLQPVIYQQQQPPQPVTQTQNNLMDINSGTERKF